jgi:hypothetical protein
MDGSRAEVDEERPRVLVAGEVRARHCPGCGTVLVQEEISPDPTVPIFCAWLCFACRHRYPPSLLKAVSDPFDYALRLRTGEVIQFQSAELNGDYVTLTLHGGLGDHADTYNPHGQDGPRLEYPCPRGVDVRLSEIVWCADAPEGS